MKTQIKTNIVSALTARTQLGQIIKRATQKNERFVVDRRGEPTVIIMSLKDYVDAIAPAPEWLIGIQSEAKRKGLDKLKLVDINRLIAEVRSDSAKTKIKKTVLK